MEPTTAAVRILVGGRDYNRSQFNRATQAQRSPGSTFKPFVYLTALSQGALLTKRLQDSPIEYEDETDEVRGLGDQSASGVGCASMDMSALQRNELLALCSPCCMACGSQDGWKYVPQNYGEKFHGTVTLEEAVVKSLNVPTVKLCDEVGVEAVVETAHACGIESRLPYEVRASCCLHRWQHWAAYADVARPLPRCARAGGHRAGRL
eukprot:scaffold659_cov329-Prasinococcus_capsulatus_cf.AAC.38